MGRAFTSAGIAINFGGTPIIGEGGTLIKATQYTWNGTLANIPAMYTSAGSQLTLDLGNYSFNINGDVANILIYGNAGVNLEIGGTPALFKFTKVAGGGTMATLDNNGNLLIKGTIGTGHTF